MEAIPEFTYQIERSPEPEKVNTIELYTTFIRPADMEPILTRSRFSCSLPTIEFIEDEWSPHKHELCYFLKESGVDEDDAIILILKLIELASEITSSVVYCSDYALSLWLTLVVAPSSQEESILDDPEIEEAFRASLEHYERNIGFKPASKLGLECLSRRKYKRNRETISSSNHKREGKRSSIADKCIICLKDFKTGRKVATLPCGHEFDNKCIVKWFKVNHVCPLCRFELPCEDDEFFQATMVF